MECVADRAWVDRGTHCGLVAPMEEVVVTEKMVDAGISEIREHQYLGDARYMVECLYRAMFYLSIDADSTNSDK